jgi:hypothetical protein
MAITLDGTLGVTTPTYGGADTSEYLVPVTAFKNRIINGAMVIDQRNAGASTNNAGGTTTYALDRWAYYGTNSAKFSIQQSSTAPTGFSNSILITSLAATTIGTNDEYWLTQKIEGFNTADLGWGTADAKTVTLSFWVRSSLTGTFGGSFLNSAMNYYYAFSYTINSANTWEQKTITVAGPTGGTWIGSTNGVGMFAVFGLSAGSTYGGATPNTWTSASYKVLPTGAVNILATNGATFYITGVQLEVGSTATSFDYRPYGTELALCQRYFQKIGGSASGYQYTAMAGGWAENSSAAIFTIGLPVSMRTAPTFGTSGTASDYQWRGYSPTTATPSAVPNSTEIGILGGRFDCSISGLTAGASGALRTQTNAGFLSFSAEL